MKLFFYSSLIICIVLISGCSKPSTIADKKILRIALDEEPPTLDPRKAIDTVSFDIIRMTQEGLVRKNLQNQCVPSLAEKIDISPDLLTYIFHLKDAQWSNGKKLTAYDFEKTWKASLSPSFPSPMSFLMFLIKNAKEAKQGLVPVSQLGVKAVNEKTLVVSLSHPAPYFLELLTQPIFFPFPSDIAGELENENFIGIGPFLIKEWKHNSEILLEKNLRYWDASAVQLNSIQLIFIQNQGAELELFETNNLDWIGNPLSSLPIDAYAYVSKKKEFESRSISGIYYYVFNVAKYPFTNKNVRKGLSLAIDRQSIVNYVSQLNQKPATSFIPTNLPGAVPSLFPDGNKQLAKQYFQKGLEELGLTNDTFPILTIDYNNSKLHHRIAQCIQQQWRELFNIQVELKIEDWKVYLNDLQNKQYCIARAGEYGLIEDPIIFLELYIHENTPNNFSGWSHPEYKRLIEKSFKQKEAEKRLQLLQKAHEILIEEMPIAPIYFYSFNYLKKPNLQNVLITPLGQVDFKWATIEEE